MSEKLELWKASVSDFRPTDIAAQEREKVMREKLSAAPPSPQPVKHTPGPWDLMAGMPTNVIGWKGYRVARCDFDGDFISQEALANARLIMVTPELLKALEGLLECELSCACGGGQMPTTKYADTGHADDCPVFIAEDAIRKAKGETL